MVSLTTLFCAINNSNLRTQTKPVTVGADVDTRTYNALTRYASKRKAWKCTLMGGANAKKT